MLLNVKVVSFWLSLLTVVSGRASHEYRSVKHTGYAFSLGHASSFNNTENCTLGNTPFRQSCYGFGQIRVTWDVAIDFCKMFGGYLAEISDKEENDFIATELAHRGFNKAWVGGSDIFHEGVWQWKASSLVISTSVPWDHRQPDNANECENCLAIHKKTGLWSDEDCNQMTFFVCESRRHAAITQTTF